jgi:hypothetical protein
LLELEAEQNRPALKQMNASSEQNRPPLKQMNAPSATVHYIYKGPFFKAPSAVVHYIYKGPFFFKLFVF